MAISTKWMGKMILRLLLITITVIEVYGHGRLIEPTSRSSMWRFGFKTEPNYNDNELFCGGYTVQWKRNRGKCGICGDPWHMPIPRDNEGGGKYGQGIIVRKYTKGQTMKATVQLTANHNGYFEFKICPTNDRLGLATQECLDQHPLRVEESKSYKYVLPDSRARDFTIHLRLPTSLQCSHCVVQWTYTSGNNWGPCPGGGSAVGCGPQETFRGCADVRIVGNSHIPDKVSNGSNEIRPEESVQEHRCDNRPGGKALRGDGRHSSNNVPVKVSPQKNSSNKKIASAYDSCKAVGVWKRIAKMDDWCVANCARGFCPSSHCQC